MIPFVNTSVLCVINEDWEERKRLHNTIITINRIHRDSLISSNTYFIFNFPDLSLKYFFWQFSLAAKNSTLYIWGYCLLKLFKGSLVVWWLRIYLPMQWTQVWPLVQEDPICCRATKPESHSYWASAPRAHTPQQATPLQWALTQQLEKDCIEHGDCQLQIGTYQEHCQRLNNKGFCHLPLWRLSPMLLWLLTFNNPQGSSGWSEALCAPGKLVRQVFR